MSSRGSLQNSGVVSAGLGKKDSYTTILPDIRGKLRKLSGNGYDNFGISGGKTAEYGEMTVNARWEWICRYDSELVRKINKTSRWLIENEVYWIESWEYISSRKYYLRFILRTRG